VFQFTPYLAENALNWFAVYTLSSKQLTTSCQVDSQARFTHQKQGLQLQAYTLKTGPRDFHGLHFGRMAVYFGHNIRPNVPKRMPVNIKLFLLLFNRYHEHSYSYILIFYAERIYPF